MSQMRASLVFQDTNGVTRVIYGDVKQVDIEWSLGRNTRMRVEWFDEIEAKLWDGPMPGAPEPYFVRPPNEELLG